MHYRVIIETSGADRPRDHEMRAALILANNYFRHDIVFLRPLSRKTPDFKVRKEIWELKSPQGDGKNTIANNMKAAGKQSKNIIIDLSRSKMHPSRAIARIRAYVKAYPRQFKRVIVLLKNEEVIDII